MLTISKPVSASQAQEYHRAEFANAKENYYTEEDRVRGEWHGRLAERWGLKGEVNEAHFARLSEGQHPHTGEQLVHHQTSREYLRPDGERVRTMEHRAGWDATFSAPKSVSLTALPGGDEHIRTVHRESVGIALDKMERYVQARIGGTLPAETTGEWIAARFEHDSSRPVNGYSAPQLHTHAVVFNITETPDGVSRALQPQELFRTQRYATAVYRAELAIRLQELGYEIERGEHGSPEIKGYSREYLEASSPRRAQIKEHLAEHHVSGAEAAQIAAHQTREKKQNQSREEVLAQHQAMAEKYGSQPQKVVARAHQSENSARVERITPKSAENAIQTAINRNMEREAVVDERAILADALRHGMGSLRTDKAHAEFAKSIEAGHLIEVDAWPGRAGHAYTTPEMKELEADVLRHWSEGRDKHESLAPDSIQNAALASHAHLNECQQSVVRAILSNRDQIMGLEGAAGTGKTTALEAVCDAARQAGFEVEGLAPTSRAAQNLESAGIETKTMARHLTEGQRETSGPPCLYIVDESSMASTRQMHDFLKSIHAEDRVLFVGDTRQHEAVDAGRPYAQLQEAGMQTAQLTEIIRQQDAALKATVEQLSVGDVEGAIRSLATQGRVHEYAGREERIQAIARAYVEQPENTLVISPDNASRLEIATTIHAEMQKLGKVSQEEQAVTVLVARQNITSEDRLWAQNYEPGDVLRYTRGNQTIDVAAREMVWVCATDDNENLITVERENGELITYDPRKVNGVTVYQEAERSFAEVDRIQFTTAFHPQKIANRELGTITALDEAGNLKLQMDSGRTVDFNLHQHPHLDYGYAVTSHSSQGETADNVLIHVDSEHAHKGLINSRMAYVAVSRARFDAQIFTNDAESLGRELGKDVSHSTALQPGELDQAIESSHTEQAHEVCQEQSVGFEQ